VIASVFVRRLKDAASFDDFVAEWEADRGYGVPTRVFNAQSIADPRDVLSIGFVGVSAEDLAEWFSENSGADASRHERIDTVVESTTFNGMFDVQTEHDFMASPRAVELGSQESLLASLH
jgi:hypothetical protein